MKEVDFDIIVPEYEPQAEALEAETAEDNAETAAEEVQAAESLSAPSEKTPEDGDSDEECSEEARAQRWRQWIIDDDIKFDKQLRRRKERNEMPCTKSFSICLSNFISSPQFDDRK